MIHAYDKVYLEKARTALGRMLDFSVYDLKYDMTEFFDLFLLSGVASRFESGDYRVLVGMSGVELAYEVLDCSNIKYERVKPRYPVGRSEEYWVGWALGYYQWETALTFSEIAALVPVSEIQALYTPYHEMDIRQFCDKMNELYRAAAPETKLKTLRMHAGLSQQTLAELSGVPVRTIQQYEQRQKNVNKARAEYLLRLSRALKCNMEDFIEKVEER